MQCTSPTKLPYFVKPSLKHPRGKTIRSPAFLNSVGLKDYMEVPCGKCLACKIRYSREWALRIIHEKESWEHSCFITLTYNDQSLPKNRSLHPRELQTFFKRLRKDLYPHKIKYFASGEYGDDKMRPHYHAIIFGMSPERARIVLPRSWEKCDWHEEIYSEKHKRWDLRINFCTDAVTFDSARYVAGYIDKKYFGEKEIKEYTSKGLRTPFRLSSQKFGLAFALKHKKQLSENLHTSVKGVPISLPRYYIKKLNIKNSSIHLHNDPKILSKLNKIRSKGHTDIRAIEKIEANIREQNNVTLQAKASIKKLRKDSTV